MRGRTYFGIVLALWGAGALHATIFGSVRGIVHDPQHRPIHGATTTLKAKLSDWKQTQATNDDVGVGTLRVHGDVEGLNTQRNGRDDGVAGGGECCTLEPRGEDGRHRDDAYDVFNCNASGYPSRPMVAGHRT